jgi:hypothetical protein
LLQSWHSICDKFVPVAAFLISLKFVLNPIEALKVSVLKRSFSVRKQGYPKAEKPGIQ